jgi:DNA-binding transcriptional LysR family regulator
LSEGKVHLALASDPPFSPDIELHRFSDERIHLIAPLNHPWSHRAEIDVCELDQVDFILPEEGSETHTSIREGLAQIGVSIYHLKVLISLGSLEAIALSVQEGLGVGFVPELVVNRLVKNTVCPIRVRGLDIQREVFVGCNIRRPATTAQEAFWQFILDPENPVLQWFNRDAAEPVPY